MMRVLHLVKTTQGARWAVEQAAELVKLGVEVHAVLPDLEGRLAAKWRESGAQLHRLGLDIAVMLPWRVPGRVNQLAKLIAMVQPDLIHSHFVTTTLLMRLALGRNSRIPRLFQVPGPYHLEHLPFRQVDLATSGPSDYWIASSQYISGLYHGAGIAPERVFHSYYGTYQTEAKNFNRADIRARLGVPADKLAVGNVSYMYPPKFYSGQFSGLKRHEMLIDALAEVTRANANIVGLLVGGQWGGGERYEKSLRARADTKAGGRIIMPGPLLSDEAMLAPAAFDLAVHVPRSENCGGVVEPLALGVPVLAAAVGGLPEVVHDGATGRLTSARNSSDLAAAIRDALSELDALREMARRGRTLVRTMFDVRRTAAEIFDIYRHVLDPARAAPPLFDARAFLERGACYSNQPSKPSAEAAGGSARD